MAGQTGGIGNDSRRRTSTGGNGNAQRVGRCGAVARRPSTRWSTTHGSVENHPHIAASKLVKAGVALSQLGVVANHELRRTRFHPRPAGIVRYRHGLLPLVVDVFLTL
ncbi:MAG: hypothetical protein R3F37_04555 [Candidatus Competibacteraceae bacterium]